MPRLPLEVSFGQCKCLGSEFDSELGPLGEETAFKGIYEAFRKKYPKADHYPYAYRLVSHSKSSDDGEPGSSAGRPLLSLLEEKDLYGYVIVARYFGGTKLGIPRLRRNIVEAAENAIAAARIGVEKELYAYPMEVDYSLYQLLTNLAGKWNFTLTETVFDIKVKTTLLSSVKLRKAFEQENLPLTLLEGESLITAIQEEKA